MDVIESMIKDMIREGQLSRARALLSLFPGEYPHLEMELEAAFGNWKKVLKIYEDLPEDVKEQYKVLYETAKEKYREDYSQEVKEALQEVESRNIQGALSLLENISKNYPDLVEAVALKYELARRRNDKIRMKRYEEILKKLDPSHPVLTQRREAPVSLFETVTMILVIAILAINLILFLRSPSAVDTKEITKAVKSAVNVEKMEASLSEIKEGVKDIRVNVGERIPELVADVKNISSRIGMLDTVSEIVRRNDETFASFQKDLMDFLNSLDKKLADLGTKIESIKASVPTPGAPTSGTPAAGGPVVTTASVTYDRARVLWFQGYIFYLKGNYDRAIDIFNTAIGILETERRTAYYEDDCYYYRALSYYFKGDKDNAKKLFNDFITRFPESDYADDAEYFIKRIEKETSS